MELTFLGQGFENISKNSVGNHIKKYLSSSDFHSFTAFSAFTSLSAINGIKKIISNPSKNWKSFNFILGINQRGTSKEALEAVLKLKVNSYVFYHDPKIIFHPKIYIFEGKTTSKIIVGSSNLTSNGLFRNIESSILVSINNKNKKDTAFLEQIKSYYKSIFNTTDPNLKPLTNDLIDNLVKEGFVPTEIEKRIDFSKRKDNANGNKQNKLFPKRILPKIPQEFQEKPSYTSNIKAQLKKFRNKKYQYTEPSYHFPQGVHIGHILYALKILKNNALSGSHLDQKYIRLRGGFSSGDMGGFQRKAKYLLVGLMELGIIEDNRNIQDQAQFKIKLTQAGNDLAQILTPLLDTVNLSFKNKSGSIPSWEMIANKMHYVSLVKALINTDGNNLLFWRSLILNMPAVTIMLELLNSSKSIKIPKSGFIYTNYYSFGSTTQFCKSLNIKVGTVENAKHRCPFLLDLLEIGSYLKQESSFVELIPEE